MNRPITTLFMLESLDGKISSGSTYIQLKYKVIQ